MTLKTESEKLLSIKKTGNDLVLKICIIHKYLHGQWLVFNGIEGLGTGIEEEIQTMWTPGNEHNKQLKKSYKLNNRKG